MRRFRGLWAYTSLLLLSACSDPPESEDTCNELANDGAEVRYVLLTDEPPTPEGGTIAPGTYELTALNLYGVNPPMSEEVRREVIAIAGSGVQWAIESNGEAMKYASTFATSGTIVNFDITWPSQYRSTCTYTATPTELRLFTEVGEWTAETALSKR